MKGDQSPPIVKGRSNEYILALDDKSIIKQFHPWIWKCSKKYSSFSRVVGFEDLYSTGMFAIFQAKKSYNPERGASLSTHIISYIKFKILNEVNSNLEYNRSTHNQVIVVQRAFKVLGENASAHEISEWTRENYCKGNYLPPKTVTRIFEILAMRVYSLDQIYESFPASKNRIELTDDAIVEDQVSANLEIQELRENIERLTKREGFIINQRLEGKTLFHIGDALGLTHERIRQIEAKAIRKLKKMHHNSLTKCRYPLDKEINPSDNGLSRLKKFLNTIDRGEGELSSELKPSGERSSIPRIKVTPNKEVLPQDKEKPSFLVGEIFNKRYKITEIIIEGLRYEIQDLETSKYIVLKHSELLDLKNLRSLPF